MSDTPQHIAAELRRLSRKCEHYCNDPRAMMVQAAAVIEQMSEGLAQMTRERDEALKQLRLLEKSHDDMADRLNPLHVEIDRLDDERDALRAEVERLRGGFERHALKAGECPPDSVVVLVSSMRRLVALQEPTP